MYKHFAALLVAILLTGTQMGCDFEILLPGYTDSVAYVDGCPDCYYDTVYVDGGCVDCYGPVYGPDVVYAVDEPLYVGDPSYVQDTSATDVVVADAGYAGDYEEQTYYAEDAYAADTSSYDPGCYDGDGDGYCDY
jgi:hypothetical protein